MGQPTLMYSWLKEKVWRVGAGQPAALPLRNTFPGPWRGLGGGRLASSPKRSALVLDPPRRFGLNRFGRRDGLKPRCCPKEPARKVPRSIHEGARDLARAIAQTDAYRSSRRQRKKVEMLFAHLKRILRLDRLRLRGPCGARDEFLLAATAQNLRKLAKLITPPTPLPAT